MILCLIFCSVLCSYIYFRIVRRYRYWKKLPIAHVETLPFVFKLWQFLRNRRNLASIFEEVYKSFAHEPYVTIFMGKNSGLLVRDAELVNSIFIKDFDCFRNRGIMPENENTDPIGANLANLYGNEWRNIRSKIMTLFSPGQVKRMFSMVRRSVDDVEDLLDLYAKNGQPVDVQEIMLNFKIDVMGRYAFGRDLNAVKQPQPSIRELGRFRITHSFVIRRILRFLLRCIHPTLVQLLPFNIIGTPAERTYTMLLHEAMDYNRSDQLVFPSFLKLLLDIQNQEREKGLSEEVALTDTLLSANLFLLFAAGIETSSVTLSCCLYELALNRDIQEKVRTEVQKATRNSELNYDVVCNELTYLDMVVLETLRKYPPARLMSRSCVQDYTLPGTSITMKEGTMFLIPIYALQNDPRYYESPEKFIPERFANFDKASKPYLPFGDGPKICPGKKVARNEIKYCLAKLLQKYSFATTEKTDIPLQMVESFVLLLEVKNGILLSVKRIND